MKQTLLFFALLFSLQLCATDKGANKMKFALKHARTALKYNKEQEQAEKHLMEAIADSASTNEQKAEAYYHAALLQKSINDGENLKLYLKQPYDTTKFFSTIIRMNRHLLSLDSVDVLPDAKGRIRPVYSKKSRELRDMYRTNLLNGGKHWYQKHKFEDAYQYFDTFIRVSPEAGDSIITLTKYWATLSAFNAGNPSETLVYVDEAINAYDESVGAILMEYKARSQAALGDSVGWLATLEQGIQRHSQHDFFFRNEIDYLDTQAQYERGFALADSLCTLYPNRALYWHAQSLMTLGLKEYEAAIVLCDSTIARDSTYADVYYIKGISYCNLALKAMETACNDMRNPRCRTDRQRISALYLAAKEPMETYRRLSPESQKRWAAPLYRIYLQLNMGKEFDEMDRILKEDSQ